MKKKSIVRILVCFALMFMLSCPITSFAAESADITAIEQTANNLLEDLFQLVNQKRAEFGTPALTYDHSLENTANIRVQEVSSSFLHTRLDGRHFSTALNDSNVPFRRCAEVLAFNCTEPEQVLNVWLSSPLHCEAILSSKYTHMGISYCVTNDGQYFWTAHLTSQ